MIITATDGAGGTAQQSTALPTDRLGKDTFLKLMVAQLRNQDPMNPTDSSEFLAQTAQFSSLEQLDTVAQRSAQALSAQMAFGASSLVGRNVTYTADDGSEASGAVGSVRFTDDGPMLEVGEVQVPINSVVAVSSAATA